MSNTNLPSTSQVQPMPEASPEKSRQRRTDGCLTCRKRRVRCGREKPECHHCYRLELNCTWPVPGVPLRRPRRSATRASVTASVQETPTVDLVRQTPIFTNETIISNDAAHAGFNDTGESVNSNDGTFDMFLSWPVDNSPDAFFNNFVDLEDNSLGFNLFSNIPQFDGSSEARPSSISVNTGEVEFRPGSIQQSTASGLRVAVNLKLEDQPIVAHFLEKVSLAATVRTRHTPNHYISLHSVSLFYPPLYAGVLAWSAWHMSVTRPELGEARCSELRQYAATQHAQSGPQVFAHLEDLSRSEPPMPSEPDYAQRKADIEAIYCAVMAFCQYELITCASPSQLGEHFGRIHRCLSNYGNLVRDSSSPLMQRMATILAAFDVRSAMFASRVPQYALSLGVAFFDDVTTYQNVSGGNIASLHLHYLEGRCIERKEEIREARLCGDTETVRRATLACDELYQRIIDLGSLFDPDRLDELSKFDGSSDGSLSQNSAKQFDEFLSCDLFMACWYNAVLIYICRLLYYPAPQRSVGRIVGASQSLMGSSLASSHIVLSKPLFFAGLESRDGLQVQWIMARLKDASARGWGPAQKTADLLTEIRRIEAGGVRTHLGEVAQQDNFNFIV